ncbi:FAD-dependent oxidoreductase [Mesorhizobium sp. KR9-304]|uniref:FAD-dependent oxidoreductase n=1 Tax=Mesorhizobium sp. KR9-304 TaxID=3156614 RepID=UPI0032B38517
MRISKETGAAALAIDISEVYDVVVIGSGAGGMATAVTAAVRGLSAIVVEKEPLIGGTTAYSGGYLWVPGHPKDGASPDPEETEKAYAYMRYEAGNAFDSERTTAFLAHGREMVEFFEANTEVRFLDAPAFSDYHPDAPGARSGGRSILTAPIDGRMLGEDIRRLRPPLSTITFVGMMFNSSQEVNHFFNVTRSAKSAWHVIKRLGAHGRDLLLHGRGMRLTSGNALAARLMLSARTLGVPILTSAPARRLLREDGRVTGVEISTASGVRAIRARHSVVLACGGFPQDAARRKALFPHAPTGMEHLSPAPPGNTGDGLRLGEEAGGTVATELRNAAAWIPVSRVPSGAGYKVFPHLIDRYKPGVIAVGPNGRRFVNEANSYHDFGQAMIAASQGRECVAWLVCDHRALRKYGLGFVKPFPLPIFQHIRSGYLISGRTPRELAEHAGFDPAAFEVQLATFNTAARRGVDPQFGKGETAYNRFLGDASHKPNPCVAALEKAPYYAIRLALGDLGTFAGLRTDAETRVLDAAGRPVPGLNAVGNDAASVMGGAYPGGGITLGPALTFGYIAGTWLAQSRTT